MLSFDSKYFDPRKICLSGQVLLGWTELSQDAYEVESAGKKAEIRREEEKTSDGTKSLIRIICPECDNDYWSTYFDLAADYGKIEDEAPKDDLFLKEAVEYGRGIRILRQNLWETLVSFIVSQNNNIPRITKSLKKIRERAEEQTGRTGFPDSEGLYEIREELGECGLGYRDMYLKKLSEELHAGTRLLTFSSDTEKAYKELLDITGIGPKVANCVLLFGLHRMERCPVDTWMKQVFANHYGGMQPEWTKSRYAGYYQQVAFFYERSHIKREEIHETEKHTGGA